MANQGCPLLSQTLLRMLLLLSSILVAVKGALTAAALVALVCKAEYDNYTCILTTIPLFIDPLTLESEIMELKRIMEEQGERIKHLENKIDALAQVFSTSPLSPSHPLSHMYSSFPLHLPSSSQSPSPSHLTGSNEAVRCDREMEFDGERWHNESEEYNGDIGSDVSVPGPAQKLPPPTNKDKLWTVEEMLLKYHKDVHVCMAGKLTCHLARLVFFGKDVMKACSPLGARNLPALPSEELKLLKKTVFD